MTIYFKFFLKPELYACVMISLPYPYFKCQQGHLQSSYVGCLTPWSRETCGQCRNTASGGGGEYIIIIFKHSCRVTVSSWGVGVVISLMAGQTDRVVLRIANTRKKPVGIVISHNRQQTWGCRIILQMELC
jgi:hypothetical protein